LDQSLAVCAVLFGPNVIQLHVAAASGVAQWVVWRESSGGEIADG